MEKPLWQRIPSDHIKVLKKGAIASDCHSLIQVIPYIEEKIKSAGLIEDPFLRHHVTTYEIAAFYNFVYPIIMALSEHKNSALGKHIRGIRNNFSQHKFEEESKDVVGVRRIFMGVGFDLNNIPVLSVFEDTPITSKNLSKEKIPLLGVNIIDIICMTKDLVSNHVSK